MVMEMDMLTMMMLEKVSKQKVDITSVIMLKNSTVLAIHIFQKQFLNQHLSVHILEASRQYSSVYF